ncbi:uncharacterized protein [Dermacentor albipictus]|uniref:uncharacterized protein n=1 Tax=Dermacentor albipictus TaxID=60249 RepID=UPI0038FBEE27
MSPTEQVTSPSSLSLTISSPIQRPSTSCAWLEESVSEVSCSSNWHEVHQSRVQDMEGEHSNQRACPTPSSLPRTLENQSPPPGSSSIDCSNFPRHQIPRIPSKGTRRRGVPNLSARARWSAAPAAPSEPSIEGTSQGVGRSHIHDKKKWNEHIHGSQQPHRSLSQTNSAESEKNSKEVKQSINMSISDEGNGKSLSDSSLDDFEPIDVDFMADLDDDSWLYLPPEAVSKEPTTLTSTCELVTVEHGSVDPVAVESARPGSLALDLGQMLIPEQTVGKSEQTVAGPGVIPPKVEAASPSGLRSVITSQIELPSMASAWLEKSRPEVSCAGDWLEVHQSGVQKMGGALNLMDMSISDLLDQPPEQTNAGPGVMSPTEKAASPSSLSMVIFCPAELPSAASAWFEESKPEVSCTGDRHEVHRSGVEKPESVLNLMDMSISELPGQLPEQTVVGPEIISPIGPQTSPSSLSLTISSTIQRPPTTSAWLEESGPEASCTGDQHKVHQSGVENPEGVLNLMDMSISELPGQPHEQTVVGPGIKSPIEQVPSPSSLNLTISSPIQLPSTASAWLEKSGPEVSCSCEWHEVYQSGGQNAEGARDKGEMPLPEKPVRPSKQTVAGPGVISPTEGAASPSSLSLVILCPTELPSAASAWLEESKPEVSCTGDRHEVHKSDVENPEGALNLMDMSISELPSQPPELVVGPGIMSPTKQVTSPSSLSLAVSSPIQRPSTSSAWLEESVPEVSGSSNWHEVHQSRVQDMEGEHSNQRACPAPSSLARTLENQSPPPGSSSIDCSNFPRHQIPRIPSKGTTRRGVPNLSARARWSAAPAAPSEPSIEGTSQGGRGLSPWAASIPTDELPLDLFIRSGVSNIPVALVPSNGGFIRLTNPQAIQKSLQAATSSYQTITEVRQFGRGVGVRHRSRNTIPYHIPGSQQPHRSLSQTNSAESEKNSKEVKQSINMSISDEGNGKSLSDSSLDDFEPIDVDFMADLDDDTWLYLPPEAVSKEPTTLNSTCELVTVEPGSGDPVAVESARPGSLALDLGPMLIPEQPVGKSEQTVAGPGVIPPRVEAASPSGLRSVITSQTELPSMASAWLEKSRPEVSCAGDWLEVHQCGVQKTGSALNLMDMSISDLLVQPPEETNAAPGVMSPTEKPASSSSLSSAIFCHTEQRSTASAWLEESRPEISCTGDRHEVHQSGVEKPECALNLMDMSISELPGQSPEQTVVGPGIMSPTEPQTSPCRPSLTYLLQFSAHQQLVLASKNPGQKFPAQVPGTKFIKAA